MNLDYQLCTVGPQIACIFVQKYNFISETYLALAMCMKYQVLDFEDHFYGSTSIKLLSIKLLSQRNPPNGTFPKNTYPKAPTTKRHPGQVNTLAVTFLTYNDQRGSDALLMCI